MAVIFSLLGIHVAAMCLCGSSCWEVPSFSILESPYFLRPNEGSRSEAVAVLSTEDFGAELSWSSARCHVNEPS